MKYSIKVLQDELQEFVQHFLCYFAVQMLLDKQHRVQVLVRSLVRHDKQRKQEQEVSYFKMLQDKRQE